MLIVLTSFDSTDLKGLNCIELIPEKLSKNKLKTLFEALLTVSLSKNSSYSMFCVGTKAGLMKFIEEYSELLLSKGLVIYLSSIKSLISMLISWDSFWAMFCHVSWSRSWLRFL